MRLLKEKKMEGEWNVIFEYSIAVTIKLFWVTNNYVYLSNSLFVLSAATDLSINGVSIVFAVPILKHFEEKETRENDASSLEKTHPEQVDLFLLLCSIHALFDGWYLCFFLLRVTTDENIAQSISRWHSTTASCYNFLSLLVEVSGAWRAIWSDFKGKYEKNGESIQQTENLL